MVHGCEKKQWVVPVLEKVEMAHTRVANPDCGAQSGSNKNQPNVVESGQCGQGS